MGLASKGLRPEGRGKDSKREAKEKCWLMASNLSVFDVYFPSGKGDGGDGDGGDDHGLSGLVFFLGGIQSGSSGTNQQPKFQRSHKPRKW